MLTSPLLAFLANFFRLPSIDTNVFSPTHFPYLPRIGFGSNIVRGKWRKSRVSNEWLGWTRQADQSQHLTTTHDSHHSFWQYKLINHGEPYRQVTGGWDWLRFLHRCRYSVLECVESYFSYFHGLFGKQSTRVSCQKKRVWHYFSNLMFAEDWWIQN